MQHAERPQRVGASAARSATVSVCVPTRDEAQAIGETVGTLTRLRERGLVDEIVVADADSEDGTAQIARDRGATVVRQGELLREFGRPLGKGDAIWRAQAVLTGDVLCFVDGDLALSEAQVLALLRPLVERPEHAMVKSTFVRPFAGDPRAIAPDGGGGRVTQLAARPLLRCFYPELERFGQPLSGQIAIRREVLADLPVSTGYGFDIGLLIDVYRRLGLDAIAEVDIGTIHNRHHSVVDLAGMSLDVHAAVYQRLHEEGRLSADVAEVSRVRRRPPFAGLAR